MILLEITASGFFETMISNSPAMGILLYFGYKAMRYQETNQNWIKQLLEKEVEAVKLKDDEIRKLNETIRLSEKENLEVLSEMNSIIDQLMNNIKINNEKVLESLEKKVQSLKEHIDLKMLTNKTNKGA
jgi:predicted transcriptional regulator